MPREILTSGLQKDFPSKAQNNLVPLEDLRRDLAALEPSMRLIYNELLKTRDRSEPLCYDNATAQPCGPTMARVLYAWCAYAIAADRPFLHEDGPMGLYVDYPDTPIESVPVQLYTGEPVYPVNYPTQAEAKPAQPEAKPAQPEAKPAQPEAKPAQPEAKPAQPEVRPAQSSPTTEHRPMADIAKPMQRGQRLKIPADARQLDFRFGWSVTNVNCDVDVSAFQLNDAGRATSDGRFIFYNQPVSEDGSTCFESYTDSLEREHIRVDLDKLAPDITRIAFILTINEAIENKLDFTMVDDVYTRILNAETNEEIAGYVIEQRCFDSITSMTAVELYKKDGDWRINAVGNGLNTDLAGQCAVFGIDIEG